MNPDEIKAFLATDEGKALLAPIIDEAKNPLLAKRDELLAEKETLKTRYKAYEELGDVDSIRAAIAKASEQGNKNQDKSFEELEQHLRNELSAKEEKINTFKSKFAQSHVENTLKAEIVNAKGVPELLLPVLQQRVKASLTDDGTVEVTVLTKDGKKMYKGEGLATVADLIEEIRADATFGRAFDGTGASGSGTRPNTDGKTGGVILDPTDPNYSLAKAMQYYKRNPGALKK